MGYCPTYCPTSQLPLSGGGDGWWAFKRRRLAGCGQERVLRAHRGRRGEVARARAPARATGRRGMAHRDCCRPRELATRRLLVLRPRRRPSPPAPSQSADGLRVASIPSHPASAATRTSQLQLGGGGGGRRAVKRGPADRLLEGTGPGPIHTQCMHTGPRSAAFIQDPSVSHPYGNRT